MSSAVRRSIVQFTRTRSSQPVLRPQSALRRQRAIAFNSTPRRFQSDDASSSPVPTPPEIQKIQETGLNDSPYIVPNDPSGKNDWSQSFHGLSTEPFSKEIAEALNEPIDPEDIEIKPDGIIYLPEIKYRRILNKAFGPGGWGLAPRGETVVTDRVVTREYALVCHGRLVSIARGEQQYFEPNGIPTATEGCKSNALMRCCKDLGIAFSLWDPRFIRKFKRDFCEEKFAEHVVNKKKRKLWRKKGDNFEYPYKLSSFS